MRKTVFTFLFLFSGVLLVSCGSEKTESDEFVLFTKANSPVLYKMQFDGKNVQELSTSIETSKVWERQREILNNICSGWGIDPTNPISVVSPDGAPLGSLEDSWQPTWSPDGGLIAVACGSDKDGNVVVVSNTEQTGNSEGWSRESNGSLSDRIEIFIVNREGSNLLQLTSNDAGDWLPRWFPSDQVSADSEFYNLLPLGESDEGALYATPLLIESNRDGNSEIYVLSTISTEFWRLTDNDYQDQSPAWSSSGTAVVFSSNRNGELEIFYTLEPSASSSESSGQKGRPYSG